MQLFKLNEECYINPKLVGIVDIVSRDPGEDEDTTEYDVKFYISNQVATFPCKNKRTAVKLVERYRRYCKKL